MVGNILWMVASCDGNPEPCVRPNSSFVNTNCIMLAFSFDIIYKNLESDATYRTPPDSRLDALAGMLKKNKVRSMLWKVAKLSYMSMRTAPERHVNSMWQ